jgi:hypothetical protein
MQSSIEVYFKLHGAQAQWQNLCFEHLHAKLTLQGKGIHCDNIETVPEAQIAITILIKSPIVLDGISAGSTVDLKIIRGTEAYIWEGVTVSNFSIIEEAAWYELRPGTGFLERFEDFLKG